MEACGPGSPAHAGIDLLPTVLPGQAGPADFGLGDFDPPRRRQAGPPPATAEAAIAAFQREIGWRGNPRPDQSNWIYTVETPAGPVGITHRFLSHTAE